MTEDLTTLRTYVQKLRGEAQDRMRADRPRLWPRVSDQDFEAVVRALGDISLIEARAALARLEAEAQ